MRPSGLKTKIFLDSGDPKETREVLGTLGFLDGQTTNPTLIAKHPEARARLLRGEKFSEQEVCDFYKKVVREISDLIPQGSVSVEVYADRSTTVEAMCDEGQEMFSWIPNAHVKYPITSTGLTAAARSVRGGIRVNMTLCFSEAQAAAVYRATAGAPRGGVFLSPFVGRLDDVGVNGMDLVKNIIQLYRTGDAHVEVLAASVRHLKHFLYALALGADIVTAPLSVLKEWHGGGLRIPEADASYDAGALQPIPSMNLDLAAPWESFDLRHDLTDQGLQKFSADWNSLVV